MAEPKKAKPSLNLNRQDAKDAKNPSITNISYELRAMSNQPSPLISETSEASCQLGEPREQKWYVLWTRSHCEDMVYDQVQAKGFHLFLPKMDIWETAGTAGRWSRTQRSKPFKG